MYFPAYITQKITLKIYVCDQNDDIPETNLVKEMCKIFMEKNSQYDYKFHIHEQTARKKKMKKCVYMMRRDLYHQIQDITTVIQEFRKEFSVGRDK